VAIGHTPRRSRTWRLTWRGREITHPILRLLVGSAAIFLALLAVVLVVVTLPMTLPLDRILKRFGRRGFLLDSTSGVSYEVTLGAFKRA
jgi:hypothetical protein